MKIPSNRGEQLPATPRLPEQASIDVDGTTSCHRAKQKAKEEEEAVQQPRIRRPRRRW